jgi:hypothetical protein
MELDLSRAQWRKSSYSGNTGNCVEVASLGNATAVRDSKNQDSPKLLIGNDQWLKFIEFVKGAGSSNYPLVASGGHACPGILPTSGMTLRIS